MTFSLRYVPVRLSLYCMKIDIRSFTFGIFTFSFLVFSFLFFSFLSFFCFYCLFGLDSKFRNKLFNKSDEFSKACYFQYLWLRQSALLIMSAPLALWTFRRPCSWLLLQLIYRNGGAVAWSKGTKGVGGGDIFGKGNMIESCFDLGWNRQLTTIQQQKSKYKI